MTTEEKLPEVAQNVFTACKKCDAERYHKVLAHTSATGAKVECEVCGSKKTYRLKKATKKKATGGRRRKAKATPLEVWSELKEKVDTSSAPKYSMKERFAAETAIDHPKFGLGVVTTSDGHKIEVVFQDGPRFLIHNRTQ